MATVSGSNSVTVAGVTGKQFGVTYVAAHFDGTGPQTGTLRIKSGTTTIFEAGVSGGLHLRFAPRVRASTGENCTAELSGGYVSIGGVYLNP